MLEQGEGAVGVTAQPMIKEEPICRVLDVECRGRRSIRAISGHELEQWRVVQKGVSRCVHELCAQNA